MNRRLIAALTLTTLALMPLAAWAEDEEKLGTAGRFKLDLPDYSPPDTNVLQEPGDPANGIPFCCDEPKFLVAAGEVLLLEAIPWFFNRHVADDETAVISLDTWGRNIREGFEWDNNDFKTNMFMHPFHGSVYFNAARSNGYNYWESAAFSWAGSFLWEMFGEANRGAINDWVATSMGGMVIGEAFHRTATSIRDNQDTGLSRGLREFSSFFLDPVGGFNRLVRGEASRVGPNPEGRHPAHAYSAMRFGIRSLNDRDNDQSLSGGFFEMDIDYGDPYEENEEPFDSFEMRFSVNGSDTQRLGLLQIDGLLFGNKTTESDSHRNLFTVNQLFDYVNNSLFEVGGQSLAITWHWDRQLSDSWWLRAQAQPTVSPLWAVQSDIAEEAEGRSYDFGAGAGGRARVYVTRDGRDWLEVRYLLNWSHTLSGAAGSHLVQFLSARVQFPVFKRVGLGFDFVYGARDSNYRDHPNVEQNGSQGRVFLTLF
ncbi:MAG: DUF3943 domain-containing protein [Acidobacteria bacterium]|nr:DUF3943 domain-containing protein [Acidobacteriota bacterium]